MKSRFKTLMDYIPLIGNSTKLLISVTLLLFALIINVIRHNSLDSFICFIAMLFSFFGDIALNCVPIQKRSHALLYMGATFFMIAHLIYASAFYLLISEISANFFNIGTFLAIILIVCIFVLSIYCISKNKKHLKSSMIFIFVFYLCIIGINFTTICSYSWIYNGLTWIGALSFLISDYIIGMENVWKIKSDILRKLVWIFYPIGQILILVCR